MRKILRILFASLLIGGMAIPLSIANPVEVSAATVTYATYATGSSISTSVTNANYNTARTAASSSTYITGYLGVGQSSDYTISRSFLYFNTTSVLALTTITSATLRIYPTVNNGGTWDLTVQGGNTTAPSTYPHNPYVHADFNYTYYNATTAGAVSAASLSLDNYNDIPLNATGIGLINKTGITTFCLRHSNDINNVAPAGVETVYFDRYNDGHPPQLVLTWDSSTVVATTIATEVAATTATLNGQLYQMVGNYTACSFEYGTTIAYGTTTTAQALTTIGTFDQPITGINYSTTYHFRAIANYGVDTYYGDDLTFTTMAAVGASTDLIIRSANVFSTYSSSGDMLITFETQCTYPPYYPMSKPSDYFQVRLVATDTTTVLAAVGLSAWGDRPGAIYLNPTKAATLTNQAAYIIRLVGYGIAGTPSVDYTLTANDWKGSDLTRLDTWVITAAENMERTDRSYDSTVAYLATSTNQARILSDSGGAYFITGIPGLVLRRPNLFNTSMGGTAVTLGADAGTWDSANAWETNMGAGTVTDLTVFGSLLGIPARTMMMGVFAALLILIVIIISRFAAGTTALGVISASFSILWCGVYFKVFPSTVIIIVVLVCVVAFAIKLGQMVSQ